MANAVAGLAVLLGLDATEYIRGLTKAEYQAKKFASNTKTAINEVEKEIAKLGIATLILDRTRAIISEAAALNDLADATGSTVESLSRLNNQVKISGGDIKSMNDAVLKLAAGMSGADSKGSKVNETLKLLGITAKDPVEALQQVAVKLATYADGVNKVGLAQALFGKSGREFLKTLQDVAELQDVQATVTAKQAKAAEDLEKSWRALAVTATTFSNTVLTVVESLERLLRLTQASGGAGLFAAMGLSPEDTANARQALQETADSLVELKKKRDAFTTQGAIVKLFSFDDIAILNKQIAVAEARQNELRRIVNSQFISRDIKPEAPKPPAGGGSNRTRALKEQTTEAQRYLESLEKQLQKTQELTVVETILADIEAGRIKGLNAGITSNLLAVGAQIDAANALKKAEEEKKKAAEEAAKAQERIQQATNNAIKSAMQETESIKQGNEQLQEQIVFLRGGQEALDRLTDARLADAIATKKQELATREFLDDNELMVAQIKEQISELRKRQGMTIDKRAAEAAAEEAKKAKQYADDLGNALAQGAENAILHFNNLRDVLKGLEQDLLRIITRKLVTQPLGDFLSGIIGAGIGGLGGSSYGMNVRASGGPVSANEPYMVGERGPELFIPKQSGSIVANNKIGGSFVFNINVPAGATRSTIDQTRLKFGMELQRVMDRSG